MKAIRTIVCYPNLLPFEPTEDNVDKFMETMAENGVTHIQVNHLPDLMHPEQISQPDNVYLWFANFGPPLDLFVSSSLNEGVYPEMYLERNRRVLLRFADSARRHGISPMMYLCEPRFVPERFFLKHPALRGPRVDNPTCSRTPLYALCTDLPEVRGHYREMMAKIMDIIPDLSMISLFTSDSGAGFDYNPDTYAGPNGAGFNKGVPLEKRVVRFLSTLLDEGRRRNKGFSINLTSGFSPEWREKILEAAPEGVVGSVYGLYDWEGGLEEQWGYHQALWGVPKAKWNIKTLDRAAAAKDRYDDMKRRFDVAARGGISPIVHAELPTTDYPRPLRYTPHPFETIRVMKLLAEMGVERIAAWGVMSPKSLVAHDVNSAAMKAVNEDIGADPAEIVSAIAEKWAGKKHAGALSEAWKICDRAWCRRPMWIHCGLPKQALPGPLVPDLTALKKEEVAYYRTVAIDDLEMIQGVGSFVRNEPDESVRDFVIDKIYLKETLPGLKKAVAILDGEIRKASDAKFAAVLKEQRDHIMFGYLVQVSHYNWYDAGRYISPGNRPTYRRSMREIIDDELRNTEKMIRLLDGRLEKFIRMMPSDFMTYEFGPGFVSQLRERVKVMKKHRDDKVRDLSGMLGKIRMYLREMEK